MTSSVPLTETQASEREATRRLHTHALAITGKVPEAIGESWSEGLVARGLSSS